MLYLITKTTLFLSSDGCKWKQKILFKIIHYTNDKGTGSFGFLNIGEIEILKAYFTSVSILGNND